jgi:predicted PurR-regulated permease PerM
MNPDLSPLLTAPRHRRFLAFIAVAVPLLAFVFLGLIVPLLAALLAYSLVRAIAARLIRGRMADGRARLSALFVVALAIIGALTGLAFGTYYVLHGQQGFQHLIQKMGEILMEAHHWLPAFITDYLPARDALFADIGAWLKTHSSEIGGMGLQFAKHLGYALLGIVLGALIAVTDISRNRPLGPVSSLLLQQIHAFNRAFSNVAGAQVRISALNAGLTALYLFALLPLFGVELPLRKTMTLVTFFVGLLPVVGNLISNSVITVIGIGYSLPVGIASILYLIIIHKLEYFLNARLVGSSIDAHAWEILLMMIIGERLMGVSGVIIAPIFYAWLKSEWHLWDKAAPA